LRIDVTDEDDHQDAEAAEGDDVAEVAEAAVVARDDQPSIESNAVPVDEVALFSTHSY
jgi:hypothetical protein